MYSRTLCSLGLAVFTLILGLSLTLSPTNQPQHNRQLVGSPSHVHLADGGAPVPPVPPIKQHKTLVADGGAPVPPVPKAPAPVPPGIAYSDYRMLADGGAPVPPVPPINQPKTLVADGGAPVPPVPPIRPSNLMADGGAPVPPVPTPPVTTFVAV
jgi:hypothetical protein